MISRKSDTGPIRVRYGLVEGPHPECASRDHTKDDGARARKPRGLVMVAGTFVQTTSAPDTKEMFNEGLTLLHHIIYFQADALFSAAAKAAPIVRCRTGVSR